MIHLGDKRVSSVAISVHNEEVVHVDAEHDHAVGGLLEEYARISVARFESLFVGEPSAKTQVPVSAALLHAIERASDEPDDLVAVDVCVLAGGCLPVRLPVSRMKRLVIPSPCALVAARAREMDLGAMARHLGVTVALGGMVKDLPVATLLSHFL